jgi:hypothetical protein
MLWATEPGLYRLIFASRKPEAADFQDWVYTEVLPEIRRKGAFSILDAHRRREIEKMCFLPLLQAPERVRAMFSDLIDALRGLLKSGDGIPPWAKMISGWLYEWTYRDFHEFRRKRNPVEKKAGRPWWRDYELMTEDGRAMLRESIKSATDYAEVANDWDDWKSMMRHKFEGSAYQRWLPMASAAKRLPAKRKR